MANAVVWLDTIAELLKPAKVNVFEPTAEAVAVALGYWRAGDGGGGLLHWDSSSTAQSDGGLVFAIPQHKVGRLIRLESGPLNVLWFGADRSGQTDSTPAFNAAINAAAAANGQTIFIPAGKYQLTNLSINSNNIHLQGAGRSGGPASACASPAGGTELVFSNGTSPGLTIVKDMHSIRDITFVTEGAGSAVSLSSDNEACPCSNKLIERCSFLGGTASCIESWMVSHAYRGLPNGAIIQAAVYGATYLFQAIQGGVGFSGEQMPQFTANLDDTVRDSTVIWQNIGPYASAITSYDHLLNVVLRDCLFSNYHCSPVVLLTGGNSTTIYVDHCYFSNNKDDPNGLALRLGAVDICQVRNCGIESSGTAIRLDNESGCIIEGCYFEASAAAHTIDETGFPGDTPGLIQINGCSFTRGVTQNPIFNLPDAKAFEVSNCHFVGYDNSDQLLPGTLIGKVRLAGNYADNPFV